MPRVVKNEELRPTSAFTREVARKIRGLVAEQGFTQEQVADELTRTQSYVSVRMQGRTGWTTAELDTIAGMLGMTGMELLAEVLRRVRHEGRP